jgi:arylsulfatase A-like enzyme
LWSNHDNIDFSANLSGANVYSADTIHAMAMQFLNAQTTNKPFFLFLPYTLPHGDVIAPHDSVYNYYIKKFNETPKTPGKNAKALFEPYPHAAFATMVSRLDRYVGQIFDAINKKGLAENTLIIFCSDNGPHRENGGDPAYFQNSGPYRGIKRDLYEGGIRVPFIAWWKGKIQSGETSQPLVLWDMYPTFQQAAAIPVTKGIDGISALPALLKKGQQQQHEYLYWEFHENNGRQALRWKNWKLIKLNVNIDSATVIELYDLDKDVAEKNNVAAQFPDIVKKLDAIIKKAHVSNPDWPLLPQELKGKKMEND